MWRQWTNENKKIKHGPSDELGKCSVINICYFATGKKSCVVGVACFIYLFRSLHSDVNGHLSLTPDTDVFYATTFVQNNAWGVRQKIRSSCKLDECLKPRFIVPSSSKLPRKTLHDENRNIKRIVEQKAAANETYVSRIRSPLLDSNI